LQLRGEIQSLNIAMHLASHHLSQARQERHRLKLKKLLTVRGRMGRGSKDLDLDLDPDAS